jgi:hypothetical protein
MTRMVLLVAAAAAVLGSGCSDDSQQRLGDALGKEGIKNVTVTDTKVSATCAAGTVVEVDSAELDRNFLGMVKTDNIRTVANKIYKQCDEKDTEKKKAEAQKSMIAETSKQLGIDVSALDENGAKKAICEKLTTQLPLKDPDRTVEDAKNQNKWGCPPAPPVTDLPTGAWQLDLPPQKGKAPVTSYARLQSDNGDRLTIRCAGKKADFYLQSAEPAKKGTKLVDALLAGQKPAKWKVKPSTDGKALFFVDVKPDWKAMTGADVVTIKVPTAKAANTVSFKVKGFGEVLKKLPKGCQ